MGIYRQATQPDLLPMHRGRRLYSIHIPKVPRKESAF
jgi:hypothetical protein